jgi:CRISPR-associated protein Cas1
MLSFVYDIADLYKTETTVPISFQVTSEHANDKDLERFIRIECRKKFHEFKLMERLLPDIAEVLGVSDDIGESPDELEGRIVTLAVGAQDWDFSG